MKKFSVSFERFNEEARNQIHIGKKFIQNKINPMYFIPDLYDKIKPLKYISASTGLILYYNNPKCGAFEYRQESTTFRESVNIKLEPNSLLAAVVGYEKKPYLIEDPVSFTRKNKIKLEMDILKNCIYCFPIFNSKNEVLVVIEIYRSDGGSYSEVDFEYFKEFGKWCGLALEQTQNGLVETNKLDMHNLFTSMLQENIKGGSNNYNQFLHKILMYCKNVLEADKIILHDIKTTERKVYLSKIFSVHEEGLHLVASKVIVHRDSEFVYMVIKNNNEVLNVTIDDNNAHMINKKSMAYLNKLISNVLYVPVTIENEVITVFAVVNVEKDHRFIKPHEEFCQIIASYLKLAYLYESVSKEVEVKSAQEDHLIGILHYGLLRMLKISDESGAVEVPSKFYEYSWHPVLKTELVSIVYFMFVDICPKVFKEQSLREFIIAVKNSNRLLAYHNFTQTILQTHFVYLVLKKSESENIPTLEEKIALMLYTFAKTVNYNGLDNETIMLMKLPITKIVSKKFVENISLDGTKDIIEKSKLLVHLPKEMYQKILKNLTQNFLDPSNLYDSLFKSKLVKCLKNPELNINDQKYRYFRISLIIWSSLNCRYLKKFDICSKLCENFHAAKYTIGEIQMKLKLKKTISPDYDKQNSDKIPALEYDYIKHTVSAMFQLLAKFFPKCTELLGLCHYNQHGYKILNEMYSNKKLFQIDESYLVDNEFQGYEDIKGVINSPSKSDDFE